MSLLLFIQRTPDHLFPAVLVRKVDLLAILQTFVVWMILQIVVVMAVLAGEAPFRFLLILLR
jgi:hypothetical protein